MNEFVSKDWKRNVSALSDEALLLAALDHARGERGRTAWLVAHLAEIWRRDLALKRGYPSLHRYAREVLGLTDAMAWERVSAARLALEIPETIERLSRGELTLAAAGELWKAFQERKKAGMPIGNEPQAALALVPVLPTGAATAVSESRNEETPEPARPVRTAAPLSPAEKRELFGKVLGKTRRESEAVLQAWKCERSGAVASPRRPLSTRRAHGAGWTELGFHLNDNELARWDRLRDLLSHRLGTRDPHAALNWLIELGLEKVDPVRQEARAEKRRVSVGSGSDAASRRPEQETERRPPTTQGGHRPDPIPVSLRRQIWIRDQGRCQHTDPLTGRRCEASAFLDLDHAVPLSEGGPTTASNLRLACASHNRRRPRWESRDQPRAP